jgi:hypothetical protein
VKEGDSLLKPPSSSVKCGLKNLPPFLFPRSGIMLIASSQYIYTFCFPTPVYEGAWSRCASFLLGDIAEEEKEREVGRPF